MSNELESLVESIINHYIPYLRESNTGIELFDPVDKNVIGFHYGETHFAVALIIWGVKNSNKSMVSDGFDLLNGFISHADEYSNINGYHWDFNNFAICILIDFLISEKLYEDRIEDLRSFILRQEDSNNATINWLPMRIYVNRSKYEWTKKTAYKRLVSKLVKKVEKAQYKDGFYEDLLPKGTSFNFQYHVYTAAVIQMLRKKEIYLQGNLFAISRSIDILDPCGDMNYFGRGLNQIFAWGPALYVYKISGNEAIFNRAFGYLCRNIEETINNNNMILNGLKGTDKLWWWDYHYTSVYTAHLLFWLVLTFNEKECIEEELSASDSFVEQKDSGVELIRESGFFGCVFSGRKHYLAENGKMLVNLCSESGEYIFKGQLGPFGSNFGRKYAHPQLSLTNYFGCINELIKNDSLTLKPIMCKNIEFSSTNEGILIEFHLGKYKGDLRFNMPLMCNKERITIMDNKRQVVMKRMGTYVGPYGEVELYQSEILHSEMIRMYISYV